MEETEIKPPDATLHTNLHGEGVLVETGLVGNGTPSEGLLGPKDRALISAACGFVSKCDRCAGDLSRRALDLGVTREELLEVAGVVQSIGYECDQSHRAGEKPQTSGECRFSEWHWAQDDGCVLGACD